MSAGALTYRPQRVSHKDFLADLADYAAAFRRTIEAEVAGFDPDPAASEQRRQAGRQDLLAFAQSYFPHYLTLAPSRMHRELCDALLEGLESPEPMRLVLEAPRGEAKSTFLSLVLPTFCACYRLKHFAVLLQDTYEQAAIALEAIKAELEVNPRLALDFPAVHGAGPVWRESEIVTPTGMKMRAAGAGKRLRGWRNGPWRPDLLVGDDLENDDLVRSPEQRDKRHAWFMRAAMRLGPPDGSMDVAVGGTVLHHDSVLQRMAANPLWTRMRYRALERMPDRMDLWEQWEEILRNSPREKAQALAHRFYAQRQRQMDKGAVLSWPAARPLYALMLIRAENRGAFESEYQNEPGSEEQSLRPQAFWVHEVPRWVYSGFVDPSMGKSERRGDPSAIVVGGIDRVDAPGRLDVVAADIRRRPVNRILADVIAFQRRYNMQLLGFESVAFQAYAAQQLVERSVREGVPVPVVFCTPPQDKPSRIEALGPHIANGLIRFHPSLRTLIEQLEQWPNADHDDGPDALAGLWELVMRHSVQGDVQALGELSSAAPDGYLAGLGASTFGGLW